MLYIIGAGVFFLYALFPSDAFIDYTLYRMNQIDPDIAASIDRVTPVFPPGLKFQSVDIQYRGFPVAEHTQIRLTPDIRSLFGSPVSVEYRVHTSGGSIQGHLVINSNEKTGPAAISGKMAGVQLGDIPALNSFAGREISGTMDGEFSGKIGQSGIDNVAADLQVTGVKVENFEPIFDLASFSFQNVNLRLALSKKRLHLKTCEAKGDELDANISGRIFLKTPIEKSILNLRGTVLPHPDFITKIQKVIPMKMLRKKGSGDGDFPVRLRGTVKDPKFSLR